MLRCSEQTLCMHKRSTARVLRSLQLSGAVIIRAPITLYKANRSGTV